MQDHIIAHLAFDFAFRVDLLGPLRKNAASRNFGLGTGRCFNWHFGRRQAALVRCSSTLDLSQSAMSARGTKGSKYLDADISTLL